MSRKSKVALIGAAATLLLSLSGCSLNSEIASLEVYAPSDGSQVDLEHAKARNFLLVERADGQAVLLGTLVNSSPLVDTSVNVQLVDAAGERVSLSYDLPAKGKYDIGYNEGQEVVVTLSETPGELVTVYLTEGDLPMTILVPVVDGTLAEYRPFAE